MLNFSRPKGLDKGRAHSYTRLRLDDQVWLNVVLRELHIEWNGIKAYPRLNPAANGTQVVDHGIVRFKTRCNYLYFLFDQEEEEGPE